MHSLQLSPQETLILCTLTSCVICIPSKTTLEETEVCFSTADSFRVGGGENCLHISALGPQLVQNWVGTMYVVSVSESSYVCTSGQFRGPCFLGVLHISFLLNSFPLLFYRVLLISEGRGLLEIFSLGAKCNKRTLQNAQLKVSVFAICCSRKHL